MLDIMGAINATTLIAPGKISLGEGNGGSRRSSSELERDAGYVRPVQRAGGRYDGNTFSPTYSTDYASASFSSPSVTVPGNGAANVTVTITPNPAMPDKGIYGGYIKFTPEGGGQDYRVPYAGFKGDYQSIQVLTPAVGCRLRIRGLTRGVGSRCRPPAVPRRRWKRVHVRRGLRTCRSSAMHLDHPARSLMFDVYGASNDKWIGTALNLDYLARNNTANTFFAFMWDGTRRRARATAWATPAPLPTGRTTRS